MKLSIAFLALFFISSSAEAAECALGKIEAALKAPLEGLRKLDRDASEPQSTEGGAWTIYREKDGRVNTIIRIDGGEGGRTDTRLSIVNRDTYGIARMQTDYIRHVYGEGPFANVRQATDYYFFCGGKLYMADAQWSVVDPDAYPKAAAEARAIFLDSKDIAEFTKGLAR